MCSLNSEHEVDRPPPVVVNHIFLIALKESRLFSVLRGDPNTGGLTAAFEKMRRDEDQDQDLG